jgi:tetratricopeptide (TPR) repeat protein
MKLKLIMTLAAALGAACTGRVQAHEDLLARIATITTQLSTNQNSVDALLQRADLYRLHGDWVESRNDYAAVQKLQPDSAGRLFGLAQLHADAGDFPAARAAYDEFISRFPTNGPACIGRARVLTQLGERKAAIADYSRGLALLTNPQPEEFLARASLQATEFGPDEAIKGLDEGMARLGWVVTFQRVAIDYELKRQRPDQALARLETILARANRKETWLAWKGEILLTAGKSREAQEALAAAIQAIEALPPRMRTSPGMVELRAKVDRLRASPRGDQSAGNSPTNRP